jgi:diguanylate cyclase (GGDEF)-like protein
MKSNQFKIGPLTANHLILLSIGIALFALVQVSFYWCAIALCFTMLILLVCRQYQNDVEARAKEVAGESAADDREENYIQHLESYIGSLEKSIATMKDAEEASRRDGSYDTLTGLPNRKMIAESLTNTLESCSASERKVAVLFLNLNRFRMVKECFGHTTGDRIIKQVADRISSSIRKVDLAGHFGSDEFAVIVRDIVDIADATAVAEQISSRVAEAVRFRNRTAYVNASIGIVLADGKYKRGEDMLRDAEIAMYSAKDGKQKWAIFEKSMFASSLQRQQLETDLRYAIVCNELELYYQPIVRLDDRSLFGFEALVRWNHPKKGMILPTEFIPTAEANGLIGPMSIQILKDACEQLARWEAEFDGQQPVIMSVNISASNLADPNLVAQIESVISETNIQPGSLKLEITESAVMDDAENAIETLRQVKETGVSLSIDDFGTGYSSLSYLQKFPIDYLKIDRSFVGEMEKGGENEEIVRTIIALAKALNLKLIAEGIETNYQFEKLRELGCEYGQGFLFSHPLPVHKAESLLSESDIAFGSASTPGFTPYDQISAIQLQNSHLN